MSNNNEDIPIFEESDDKWKLQDKEKQGRSAVNPKRLKVITDFYDYVKRHTANFHGRPPIPFRIGKRFK